MVINMTQKYLIISTTTNIVENICMWDGDESMWKPPEDHIALPHATTPAMVWEWSNKDKDFVKKEQVGAGNIGDTWDGTHCITNEEKPVIFTGKDSQPATMGTQPL